METFPLSNQGSLIPNNPFQMKSEFVFYLHHELGEKSNHLKLTVLSNHSIDILCEGGNVANHKAFQLRYRYLQKRKANFNIFAIELPNFLVFHLPEA